VKFLLPLALVCALVLPAAPDAAAVSTTVTISEVYPVGGLPSASFTNDYVELFNLTGTAIDVTGWTLQSAASGPFSGGLGLSGQIPANGYLLVGLASGGPDGSALPTPDATASTDLSSPGGKVRLINGSATVVDLVGYDGADESETAPTDFLQNTDASFARKDGGCVDTDNNRTNFTTGDPADPQNSSNTHVCGPHTAPVLAPIGPKSVETSELLTITAVAEDGEGDPLTYSATGLPAGASFDDADTHQLSWIPSAGQEGPHVVHFEVSDGIFTDSEDVTITVTTGSNDPPVITPIADRRAKVGQIVTILVTATDGDDSGLVFSNPTAPAGSFFDDETHTFTWIPDQSQLGDHTVTFSATDGEDSGTESLTITVVPGITTVTLDVSPTKVASGSVSPSFPGVDVAVRLFKLRSDGKWKLVDRAFAALDGSSTYSAQMSGPNKGRCRVTATVAPEAGVRNRGFAKLDFRCAHP
jgi:hypothetical protein